MRVFFFAIAVLVAFLALVQRSSGQTQGSVLDRMRCLTCPGNDDDKKDCCAKTKMCCDGRVKFQGSFPQPFTTAYGK